MSDWRRSRFPVCDSVRTSAKVAIVRAKGRISVMVASPTATLLMGVKLS